jgi:hypothetical protein
MSAVDVAITPTYSVHIEKVGDDEVECEPFTDAKIGDTVRYYTEAKGEVSIEFPGPSPFRRDDKPGTTVPGEVILTVVSQSTERGLPNNKFESRCYIQLTGGKKIGWKPGYDKAGSNLHVPHP